MGDADVERHGRDAIARQGLAHENLADDRTIAVRDDQFGLLERCEWKQRFGRQASNVALLVGRAGDVLGMCRVAADCDDQPGRDGEGSWRH
jgi:hypothetical protein